MYHEAAVRQGQKSMGQRDIPAHRIQHQKMSRVVWSHFLLTRPLQMAEKGSFLKHSVRDELEFAEGCA